VMFLEMAMDTLKSREADIIQAETKAFNSLGPMRMNQILQSLNMTSTVGSDPLHPEMMAGYLLGLETARVLLSMMPAAVQAGVSI